MKRFYLLHQLSSRVDDNRTKSESGEEFFDTENSEVKEEVPVENKMASENKGFTLQVFHGTHYDKWKYKLKFFLEFKECSKVIENDERPMTIEEDD